MLFREDIGNRYSVYGGGDILYQFTLYINGYKKAADDLVATSLVLKHDTEVYIYPICFLYRQYLELRLKKIYMEYSGDSREEKKKVINKTSHSLKKIWDKVKIILEKYIRLTQYENTVDRYIDQYDRFDKESFSFRYPITKQIELIHNEVRSIDLAHLKQKINELDNYFKGLEEGLDATIEFQTKMDDLFTDDIDY